MQKNHRDIFNDDIYFLILEIIKWPQHFQNETLGQHFIKVEAYVRVSRRISSETVYLPTI